MSRILKIGTRGSELAVTQSTWVRDMLRAKGVQCELKIIKTSGDKDQVTPLHQMTGLGVFVVELQKAMLDGRIDLAIHSLKDVPFETPKGLSLVSFPPRENPKDALVGKYKSIEEIPRGGTVGTGSPRRVLQLKKLRPDLKYLQLRGNVGTRVEKATSGEMDAVVLACAGLNRLGRCSDISYEISIEEMLPAISQGIVAMECRSDDSGCIELLRRVNDVDAEKAQLLERMFMERLGGGCKVPMAALAVPQKDGLWSITSMIADLKGEHIIRKIKIGDASTLESCKALVEKVVLEIEAEAEEKKVLLPRELPEHYLLEHWKQ
jgi:hydroxymethylbilane synthase